MAGLYGAESYFDTTQEGNTHADLYPPSTYHRDPRKGSAKSLLVVAVAVDSLPCLLNMVRFMGLGPKIK
jgi:hypothetical protein